MYFIASNSDRDDSDTGSIIALKNKKNRFSIRKQFLIRKQETDVKNMEANEHETFVLQVCTCYNIHRLIQRLLESQIFYTHSIVNQKLNDFHGEIGLTVIQLVIPIIAKDFLLFYNVRTKSFG